MRWTLILLTTAGGALTACLAYPYGILAACLAYLFGGMAFAALGLWTFTREKATAPDATKREPHRSTYGSSRIS